MQWNVKETYPTVLVFFFFAGRKRQIFSNIETVKYIQLYTFNQIAKHNLKIKLAKL